MIIDKHTFESVKAMLESPDQENLVLGMTTLQNLDFVKNIVPIMCLIKKTDIKESEWKTHAPELVKNVESVFQGGLQFKNISISMRNILKMALLYNSPKEHITMAFELHFKDMLHDSGSMLCVS